jgi:hypothetical protein
MKIKIVLLVMVLTIPIFGVKGDSSGTLPVELLYFVGEAFEDSIQLRWATATEINNYGFEVQRTQTFTDWLLLGFVEGHGTSNSNKYYSFPDTLILPDQIYFYRLKQIDNDGAFKYTDTIQINSLTNIEEEIQFFHSFSLDQNYPNPFNPLTRINFSIPNYGKVKLILYDIAGNEVITLIDQELSSGYHSVNFNAANLSSGIYLYRLTMNNFSASRKLLLLK